MYSYSCIVQNESRISSKPRAVLNLFVLPSHLQALNGQQSDSKEKEEEEEEKEEKEEEKEEEEPEEKEEEEEEDEEEDDSSDPDIDEEIQASRDQAGPGKKCINHLHLLLYVAFPFPVGKTYFSFADVFQMMMKRMPKKSC